MEQTLPEGLAQRAVTTSRSSLPGFVSFETWIVHNSLEERGHELDVQTDNDEGSETDG